MVLLCLPSDALSQHLLSYLGFSYLGRGVSLYSCSSRSAPAATDRAYARRWGATPRPRSGASTENTRLRLAQELPRGTTPRPRSGAVVADLLKINAKLRLLNNILIRHLNIYKYITEKASSKIDPPLPTPEEKIQCNVQASFSEFQSNIGRHQRLRVFEAFEICAWKLNQKLTDNQKQLYSNLEF